MLMRLNTTMKVLFALQLLPWFAVRGAEDHDHDHGEEEVPIVISIQNSFMAMAYHIGLDKGYFKELGLAPETILYPSGQPQIMAAIENKTWDIGVAGVVPNINGGFDGLHGIAIAFDQSAINQLVGNGNAVDADSWPPASLEGEKIVLSPASTGDFVVQACLNDAAEQNTSIANIEIIHCQQNECIEMMNPSNGSAPVANYGGLWAPNSYRFLDEAANSKVLCQGDTVYAIVTGGFMVRKEYADEHPDRVQKLLAGWLRGITWIQAAKVEDSPDRPALLAYMKDFYSSNGLDLSDSALESDLRLLKLFNLQQQLEAMERKGNPPTSLYDTWTEVISQFMVKNNVTESYPEPNTYITDEHLKAIDNDPCLKAWANGDDIDYHECMEDAGKEGSGSFSISSAFSVLFGLLGMLV